MGIRAVGVSGSLVSISDQQVPESENPPAIVATQTDVWELFEAIKFDKPERCKLLKFACDREAGVATIWHSGDPTQRFTITLQQFNEQRNKLLT